MRLLAIQELPQSKRVKLVFDDDSVLKTQPYLLADFGLYSGMDLTDEDYQALLTAAGKASAKARPFALSQRQAYLKRNFRNGLSKRARKQLTHRRLSAGSKELHLLDDRGDGSSACCKRRSKGLRKEPD